MALIQENPPTKKLLLEHHYYNFILALFTEDLFVAKDIKKELIQILKAEGIKNIREVIGKGN